MEGPATAAGPSCIRAHDCLHPGSSGTLQDSTVVRSNGQQKLKWDSTGVTVTTRRTGAITRHIDPVDISRVTRSPVSVTTLIFVPLIAACGWSGRTDGAIAVAALQTGEPGMEKPDTPLRHYLGEVGWLVLTLNLAMAGWAVVIGIAADLGAWSTARLFLVGSVVVSFGIVGALSLNLLYIGLSGVLARIRRRGR